MGAGLIGDDVDVNSSTHQLGQDRRGVRDERDAPRRSSLAMLLDDRQRRVEVRRDLIKEALRQSTLRARRIDFDDESDAFVHRDREGLRAAHAPKARGDCERALERSTEVLARDRGERLVRPLQDPLRADVDPRARGHLPVHRQTERLELAEFLPCRPARDEEAVRDEHARRPLVRAEDADRLSRLHEKRLVLLETRERRQDAIERGPRARRASGAAVHDELVGPLRDVRVEVVLDHPERGFLRPGKAREL